jgi:RNA polymerase sigma factor (sigma-70 family)
VTLDLDGRSDAELITAVRDGDTSAYGVLYERHLKAAKRAASCLTNSLAEREDLVSDAFARVLRVLRDGRGPDEEFRAYLLVTMRNAAISSARGATVSLYADVPETYLPRPGGDPMVQRWDSMTAAAAFATLPERWRTVLWHTEVEEESPAEIAPLLGMSANGVAALAYRAREGLRQAYLKAHLRSVEARECRATVSKLAGWVRHSVPVPLGRKISRHLAMCSDCRARADTLTKVNQELRASVAPVLLGATFAAAYLPASAGAASGAVAVKALVAKVAVAAAIAATAMTTMASSPNVVGDDPMPGLPVMADPMERTDSIEGPSGGGGGPGSGPGPRNLPGTGAPSTNTTTVPPSNPNPNAEPAAETTVTTTATTAPNGKKSKEDKQAAKESKKAEKEATKESKKAENGNGNGNGN